MPEKTTTHSTRVDEIRLAWVQTYSEATDNDMLIAAARRDIKYLVEQLQALQTAAQRILEAPKGTSHSQFRFWLMDALGDATPARERPLYADGSVTATPLPPGATAFYRPVPNPAKERPDA